MVHFLETGKKKQKQDVATILNSERKPKNLGANGWIGRSGGGLERMLLGGREDVLRLSFVELGLIMHTQCLLQNHRIGYQHNKNRNVKTDFFEMLKKAYYDIFLNPFHFDWNVLCKGLN